MLSQPVHLLDCKVSPSAVSGRYVTGPKDLTVIGLGVAVSPQFSCWVEMTRNSTFPAPLRDLNMNPDLMSTTPQNNEITSSSESVM